MPFTKIKPGGSSVPEPAEAARANIYLESISCEGVPPSVRPAAPQEAQNTVSSSGLGLRGESTAYGNHTQVGVGGTTMGGDEIL
jgi:hypothetical protein